MFKPTDGIRGRVRGSAAQAIQAIRLHGGKGDYVAYVEAVYELAPPLGIDPAVVVAQAIWETNWFTAAFWVNQGNPGGIGIDGDDSGNSVTTSPFSKLTGREAAVVHLATLFLKLDGTGLTLPDALKLADTYCKSYLIHVRAMTTDGNWPPVNTIQDLCLHFKSTITGNEEATWAWDLNYASGICARTNMSIFPGVANWSSSISPTPAPGSPMLVYGRVPHPDHEFLPIYKRAGHGQDNLGKRTPRGVVLHRMEGSLWGTNTYFRRDDVDALTDYGVGCEVRDGASNDGHILKWNDVYGYQTGWASGPYKGAYGDGLAFYNKYGLNAVNRDQVSVEVSGDYDTPVTLKCLTAVAALIAYYADQYHISWEVFPTAPEGFSFVRWHQEFTRGSGKICPGSVIMNATNQIIAIARAIMKSYQEVAVTDPVIVVPTVPDLYPPRMDLRVARQAFGSFKASNRKTYRFSETGKVSRAWLAECAKTQRYPRLIFVDVLPNSATEKGRLDFYFSDGMIIYSADGERVPVVRG